MASEKEKEQVRDRTNIVELISSYTRLKKAGNFKYKGLCPFHTEKDGSFTVDEELKLWHCFGCQRGGDMFSFVMEAENVDFGEALEILAKRAGVTLTDQRPGGTDRRKIKDKILKINELATKYFYKVLTASKSGERFLQYLEERQVPPEQMKSFKLGASQDSWDSLIRAFGKRGYTAQDLVPAGLVVPGEKRAYDRFRDRLIFPLFNIVGDVVGFAGRAMGDAMPKYLNTPETPLFDKGKMLYALDRAKKTVGEHGIILTEGYMDVIALHRYGITSAVASMGTALTPAQVDLLRRHASRVVLAYDSDIAGDSASMRGIELLVDRGLDIRVVSLPEGEDPDSIVVKGGAAAFERCLESAADYFDFFLNKCVQRTGAETPGRKRDVIMQMAPLIEKTPNAILRDEQIRLTADRLGVTEQHVQSAMSQLRDSARGGVKVDTGAIDAILSGSVKVENKIMELLMSSPSAAKIILAELDPTDFSDRNNRAMFSYCLKWRDRAGGFDPDEFLNAVHPQEAIRIISGIPLAKERAPADVDKEVKAVLKKFLNDVREKQMADLKRQAEHAQKEGDMDLATQLAARLAELKKGRYKKS